MNDTGVFLSVSQLTLWTQNGKLDSCNSVQLEIFADLPFQFLQKHAVKMHLQRFPLIHLVVPFTFDKKNVHVFEASHFKSRALIKKRHFSNYELLILIKKAVNRQKS